MRVLTYLKPEEVDELLNNTEFKPSDTNSEGNPDYSLVGGTPIYGFVHPNWRIGVQFNQHNFEFEGYFDVHRSQLKLPAETGLREYLLVELDLPQESLQPSLYLNSFEGCVVLASISRDSVTAVYDLEYPSKRPNGHLYACVDLRHLLKGCNLFSGRLQTKPQSEGKKYKLNYEKQYFTAVDTFNNILDLINKREATEHDLAQLATVLKRYFIWEEMNPYECYDVVKYVSDKTGVKGLTANGCTASDVITGVMNELRLALGIQ